MFLSLANWHPTLSQQRHTSTKVPFWPLANAFLFHVFSKCKMLALKHSAVFRNKKSHRSNLWFVFDINFEEILSYCCFKYCFCSILTSFSVTLITYMLYFCSYLTFLKYFLYIFSQNFFSLSYQYRSFYWHILLFRDSFLGLVQSTNQPIKSILHLY